MIKDNLVPASALCWKFPDRETPFDAFVRRVIQRKAEHSGDAETSKRISLFERDVDERGVRAGDEGSACTC